MGTHFMQPKGADFTREAMAAELLDAETEVRWLGAGATIATSRRCTGW